MRKLHEIYIIVLSPSRDFLKVITTVDDVSMSRRFRVKKLFSCFVARIKMPRKVLTRVVARTVRTSIIRCQTLGHTVHFY